MVRPPRQHSRGLDLLLGLPPAADATVTAQRANVVNNARFQDLRLERWSATRDALWALVDRHLGAGARVLIVGAGNGDDLPLQRLADRAGSVTLVDIDAEAAARARARVTGAAQARITFHEHDVTGGAAEVIVASIVAGADHPTDLDLPTGAIAGGDFDLVLGDMLYTQLLQPALVQLRLPGARQLEYMRAFDGRLTEALVQRLQRSAAPQGRVVHVHDVACWSGSHDQPMELEEALSAPEPSWARLKRHDQCDPQLALERLRVLTVDRAWWEWPFEPNKRFLARGTVAVAGLPVDRR
ncbi:MAG: hypothetical protein JWN72_324 [Thermoleophilia bacterium]|nr:hypothetical protein [Thermoleophilia bacterium]